MAVSIETAASILPKLVGAMVLHYAKLEHWLDGMVKTIYDTVSGAQLICKGYPFNAVAERKFLRECFEQLPQLQGFKEEAMKLLDDLELPSERRHDIVHGHLSEVNLETGDLEFTRVFPGVDKKPLRRTISVSAVDLLGLSRQINDLRTKAEDLTQRLIATFAPEYLSEKPPGST